MLGYHSMLMKRYSLHMKLIAIGLTCLLLVSCDQREWKKIETDDGKLTQEYQVIKGTDDRDGIAKYYDEQGNLQSEASYVSGVLEGPSIMYSPAGDTLVIETYRNGKFHGLYRSYYEDGSGVKQEGQYVDGAMKGIWYKYYPSGQLAEKVPFTNNLEQGPFMEYHANGNLKTRGVYLDGDNEHGPLELYDEDGELSKRMDCVRGNCTTVWKQEKDEVIDEDS